MNSKSVKYLFLPFGALLLGALGWAAETIQWVNKPILTFEERSKNWHVAFELNSPSDVEVAIVDPDKSIVVRPLAAGVLGAKVPPPLNSVDATDIYIYVADMVNLRLLRLRKNFKMIASSQ